MPRLLFCREQSLSVGSTPSRRARRGLDHHGEHEPPDVVATLDEARAALEPLIGKVWSYCEGSAIRGRTVTLKAKYADFRQVTRSRTVEVPVASRAVLEELVSALLEPLFPVSKGIRLLGVTLSSLQVGSEPRVVRQLRLPL